MTLAALLGVLAVGVAADPYSVKLVSMSETPVISSVNKKGAGYSPCNYTFNPSYVPPSQSVPEGVLLRTALCPDEWGGEEDHIMWAPCDRITGRCGDLVNDIVVPSHSEDPRVVYDPTTKTYYNFYYANNPPKNFGQYTVNYAVNHGNPYNQSEWVLTDVLPWHRNGCLILRDSPPHYVVYGEAPAIKGLGIAVTDDLRTFRSINSTWMEPDPAQSEVVIEAGSPPVRLSTGDYFHLYAAGTTGWVANGNYTSGYVILDSRDPSRVVQKSTEHILISTFPYQIGEAPYPTQRHRTIFAPTAVLLPPSYNTDDSADFIRVWFGAADASVGTAVIRVSKI